MFDTVIKNGKLYVSGDLISADVAITGKKISAIGNNLSGKIKIDANNKWVFPGAIDAHTHFSLPFAGAVSADDFYTGTRAAAFGGVTTIIDFLGQNGDEGIKSSYKRRLEMAAGNAVIDFSFHACIGKFSEKVKNDFDWLSDAGLTSLKIFMAYGKVGLMQSDYDILEILKKCRKYNILVTVHAENGQIIDKLTEIAQDEGNLGIDKLPETRPVFTETEAIQRIAEFSRVTGCPIYIVHVSSGDGADTIRQERLRGVKILGETCPQYLYLDSSKLVPPEGQYFGCCPPIRSKDQQQKIWEGLASGHIAVSATDHCPFTKADKNTWDGKITELPMGLPGVETMPTFLLWAVNEGRLTLKQAVDSFTINPAKIFGLYPEKGTLLPGSDADLFIFDPEKEKTIKHDELHMNLDYSPFEGMSGKGAVETTMSKGELIVDHYQWKGKKGAGSFLSRKHTDERMFD